MKTLEERIEDFKDLVKVSDDVESELCDYTLCSRCGGCCKSMGCHIAPNELKEITVESITKLIETGLVSIDWWETDQEIYFLRIRNEGTSEVYGSWGNEKCILLTDNGCRLDFSHRPKGARHLIPRHPSQGDCISNYTKEQCVDEWEPYQDVLSEVASHYEKVSNSPFLSAILGR